MIWGAASYVTPEETEMLRKIKDIDQWSEKMKKPFIDVYGEEYFRKAWAEWVDAYIGCYYEKRNGMFLSFTHILVLSCISPLTPEVPAI